MSRGLGRRRGSSARNPRYANLELNGTRQDRAPKRHPGAVRRVSNGELDDEAVKGDCEERARPLSLHHTPVASWR